MLKIGDFARLSHVPVKTLRYYDEIGLLKPRGIDHYTRYRYYSSDQLPTLYRILTLKELGFSLEQIAHLLEDDLVPEQLKEMLARRRADICQSIQQAQAQLRQVEAWLEQIEREGQPELDEIIASAHPLRKEKRIMEPKFETLEKFYVVGMPYLGKNEHGEISQMWGRFNRRTREIRHVDPQQDVAYGLCFQNDHGLIDYVAGLPVTELTDIPQGMVGKEVPKQTYVVFEAQGTADIGAAYQRILEQWMPSSGYRPGDGPDFEYYPPDFDPAHALTSKLYIYFPVEREKGIG